MKRSIETHLNNWRLQGRRKPLILRGARQVGKTYSISSFGKTHFPSFVRIDFERDLSIRRCFEGDLNPHQLIARLEVHVGTTITPGSSLLFFDEIQKCPRALTSLRYFYEELPKLHIIAAGSLLELTIDEQSFPVGSVDFAWLRPLSFAEYIEATGNLPALRYITSRSTDQPIPDAVHSTLIGLLKEYWVVGGMPEAVGTYLESHSHIQTAQVHRNLIQSYLADIQKYCAQSNTDGIDRLLANIPAYTGRPIKYSHLEPSWRVDKIKRVLGVLEKALIVNRVRSTTATALPLGAAASDKMFKLIFMDIGLMQHLCGIAPNETLQSADLLAVYRGALAEQFVGQEILAANMFENEPLYCWFRPERNADAEIDYVIVRDSRIIPVEVKSGSASRLKSMHLFLQEHPSCAEGIILSTENVRIDQAHRLRFLPLYTPLT